MTNENQQPNRSTPDGDRTPHDPKAAPDTAARQTPPPEHHVVDEPSGPVGATGLRENETIEEQATRRHEVHQREKAKFGGFKFGAAFFGWLTATGTAVILTALVTAAGVVVGMNATEGGQTTIQESDAAALGIGGAIALGVVALVSYFCGGYVAGRMSRFDGLKQGLAVWLWAIAIAIIVALIAAVAGSQFDVLGNLNSFPRIPLDGGTATTASIITAAALALVALIGALLGGLAGMRFHRRVERAGFGA